MTDKDLIKKLIEKCNEYMSEAEEYHKWWLEELDKRHKLEAEVRELRQDAANRTEEKDKEILLTLAIGGDSDV